MLTLDCHGKAPARTSICAAGSGSSFFLFSKDWPTICASFGCNYTDDELELLETEEIYIGFQLAKNAANDGETVEIIDRKDLIAMTLYST